MSAKPLGVFRRRLQSILPKYLVPNRNMEEEIRTAVDENASTSAPESGADGEVEGAMVPDPDPAEKWGQEKAELQDLLRRRQAEFENYRRRIERERSEFAEYASMSSVSALLPI